MKRILIGVAGRKGSGKDTAAKFLIDRHSFKGVKFAAPLKNMLRVYLAYCGEDYDTIERMIEGDLKEKPSQLLRGNTPRYAMVTLGTEWGRNLIGDDLWLYAFGRRSQGIVRSICTDMRFQNEVELIKNLGGYTIKIVDPSFAKPEAEHASEAYIDEMVTDLVFFNDKSLHTKEEFSQYVANELVRIGVIS